jgi:hypothetical protein
VVGDHMKEEFSAKVAREYPVISNGFDDADFMIADRDHSDQKFSIAHFGTIYPLANPQKMWNILADKAKTDPLFSKSLEIKLVGKADHTVMSGIAEAGLKNFVRKIGYLPHDEVVKEMQKSQVLLLLVNRTPQAVGILTGKLFEYLAAKRPIICLGPINGDAAELIRNANAGLNADYNDEAGIRSIIGRYFELFMEDKLVCDSRNIDQFSRRNLTRRMAEVLDKLIE